MEVFQHIAKTAHNLYRRKEHLCSGSASVRWYLISISWLSDHDIAVPVSFVGIVNMLKVCIWRILMKRSYFHILINVRSSPKIFRSNKIQAWIVQYFFQDGVHQMVKLCEFLFSV